MKFVLLFKTPDVLDQIKAQIEVPDWDQNGNPLSGGYAYDARREQEALLRDEADRLACEFVEYGECIKIEFDTEVGTATVLKR